MEFGALEKTLLPIMLAVVMFGMGMGLQLSDFRRVLQTPLQAIVGSVGHFIVMPLAAFIVIKLTGLAGGLALGVIIVGSSPSGPTSNLLNYLAKADVALAVIITTLSTLLCPIATPFVVQFMGNTLGLASSPITVSFIEMLKLVFVIIAIPISLGMIVRSKAPAFADSIERPYKIFSVLFLLGMIAFVLSKNWENFLKSLSSLGPAIVLHNGIGLFLGFYSGKIFGFGTKQCRTLAIEVGIQNTTLAMTIAVTFFTPETALPGAIFSLWMYVTGLAMATYWSKNPVDGKEQVSEPQMA
ncbi:MAG: bile acid:sodium symporter family protein [Bacteroidota bacterium]|nr:bile acid:sodium symporter family protein [Candidatus Kapabacteria bacterium]MDW8220169.1 bile acid:sodium symporter family protein [Bacteroidota bacterium]